MGDSQLLLRNTQDPETTLPRNILKTTFQSTVTVQASCALSQCPTRRQDLDPDSIPLSRPQEAVPVPGVRAEDRRRLDLVIYGATPDGSALCCDATLVSPLTRTGQPEACAADVDGAALRTAERRKAATYPELQGAGPQKLVVLGSEVGGRFNSDAHRFVRDLVRLRSYRAPPALRAAAASGWTRRWWGMLSVAVQQAVASTALG